MDRTQSERVALVVDDNAFTRTLITYPLIEEGFRVQVAASGAAAVEVAAAFLPQIVVSRDTLPDMDGVTLCMQLEARLGEDSCATLLLSGEEHSTWWQSGLSMPDDYLVFPFVDDELVARVRRGISLRAGGSISGNLKETQEDRFSKLRHDLNNPLFVIMGGIEGALKRLEQIPDSAKAEASVLISRLERSLLAASQIQSRLEQEAGSTYNRRSELESPERKVVVRAA